MVVERVWLGGELLLYVGALAGSLLRVSHTHANSHHLQLCLMVPGREPLPVRAANCCLNSPPAAAGASSYDSMRGAASGTVESHAGQGRAQGRVQGIHDQ